MRKRVLKLLMIGCLGFILLGPQIALSQEAEEKTKKLEEKKTDVIKLDDVHVTAFYGDAVTITPTRTIIDVEKFIKSGTVERVEDILMHMAGVDVLRTSPLPDPQQIVLMRGFDDSRFVVAIDGRPITAPTAGADTFVDWSSLTTADIEKIEVIRAGSSALYENAQGGVINIITKKGTKRDTAVPKTTFQADYARYNTHGERVTLDGGFKILTYFLNFGYKESDGYLRNNNWRSKDYAARFTFGTEELGDLSFSFKGSDNDFGYPVVNDPGRTDYDPSYPTVPEDSDTLRKFRTLSYPGGKNEKQKRAEHYDVIYNRSVGKTSALKLHLFLTRGDEDSWYVNSSGKQNYSGDEAREETQWGGTMQYRFQPWDTNTLTLGYDHRRMEVKSMEDLYRFNAGYFDDLWAITPKLSLNTGLRFVDVREWTYPLTNYPVPGAKERKLNHHKLWLPKSTLSYSFTPRTKAYISINKEYHVPGC